MEAGIHLRATASQGTAAMWRAAREMIVGRRRRAAVNVAPSGTNDARSVEAGTPTEPPKQSWHGKKRRYRMPLRMTPKAQRRRWFRQQNKRVRALALRDMRDRSGLPPAEK
jgi:hypothetical protein